MAEGVHRLHIPGVEPAVAHEGTFGVLGDGLREGVQEGLALGRSHLQDILAVHQGEQVATGVRIREIAQGKGRGILKLGRESERELSGGGDVAEQDLGEGGTAFGTVPPCLDDGRGGRFQDAEIGGTAGDENAHEVRISFTKGADDGFLTGWQEDILAV